jgi:quinol monooxygenase YgiN
MNKGGKMPGIIVISRCHCLPGKEADFLKAAKAFLKPTRSEAGCESYRVYRDVNDPSGFIFNEGWRDQAGINAHIASEHFKVFMAACGTLLEAISGNSPFQVTIAQAFDPAKPPSGEEVVVSSFCSALPFKARAVVKAAGPTILEPSRQEPGCKAYRLFQDIEGKSRFILFEVWKGYAAIQAHMSTPHFAAFMAAAPKLFSPVAKDQYFAVMICSAYAG